MELNYYLLNTYSKSKDKEQEAITELQFFIDKNYLEESDVIFISKTYETVIFIEVEQDDGHSEAILVDNLGIVCERIIYSDETIEEAKSKVKQVGMEKYFDSHTLQLIEEYIQEYNYTHEEIQMNKIEQFLLVQYENTKEELSERISIYYK